MEPLDKIQAALTGIEKDDSPFDRGTCIVAGIIEPPSYIVRSVLCGILGLPCYRGGDKSEWETYIVYRGHQFLIRDWKRSSWSIDSPLDSKTVRQIGRALERKVKLASQVFDKALAAELAQSVEKGDFYIENAYYKIRFLFEFFRDQAHSFLDKLEKETARIKSGPSSKAIDRWLSSAMNRITKLERCASHNACAMIAFYFSYTELLFDILYTFSEKQPLSFKEFRGLTWSERFKLVLPVAGDRALARIYQKLLNLKRQYRDVILHGYVGEEGLLVPLKKLGLVPISYHFLRHSVHYSPYAFDPEGTRDAIEACTQLDKWLDANSMACYAVLYAQTGFEIPYDSTRVGELRKHMTSAIEFKRYLEEEAMARDYFHNRY